MKIRPGEAADVIIDTSKSRAEAAKNKEARGAGNQSQVTQPGTQTSDKIDVGATKQITELLKDMDSKSRVEHFKALVETGQYKQPSAEVLAGAVATAIDEEIDLAKLLDPAQMAGDDDEGEVE